MSKKPFKKYRISRRPLTLFRISFDTVNTDDPVYPHICWTLCLGLFEITKYRQK